MSDQPVGLAAATMRLAGEDIYRHAIGQDGSGLVNVDFDFDGFSAEEAHTLLDQTLTEHATNLGAPAAPDAPVVPEGDQGGVGADLAYRLAVVDAAFRPTNAFDGPRRPSDDVRHQLEQLIQPAIRDGAPMSAAEIVNTFEIAHANGTRATVPAIIAASVEPAALTFLTLECSVQGESVIVDGAAATAMCLFDYQETTMSLAAIQGVTDPLNWPQCNEAFTSVTKIPGSYWESPHACGIDIVEVLELPFLSFKTTTALSITYIDTPTQKMMTYDLSTANASHGDGQVAVDRGFARAVDLGPTRRGEALKVVHFRDDDQANAASWFACLWWDLLTVRTATLCPNKVVTPKSELERDPPSTSTTTSLSTSTARSASPSATLSATPSATTSPATSATASSPTSVPAAHTAGPIELFVTAWGDVMSGFTSEAIDLTTRTAKRWPPGEQVTAGKLTSDLIEGFERLTPTIGKSIDLWLGAAQQAADTFSSRKKPPPTGGTT